MMMLPKRLKMTRTFSRIAMLRLMKPPRAMLLSSLCAAGKSMKT
jgi:hypothetical protein